MSRKFYTIFILPHAHERFRKLHISRNFILTAAVCLGLVALAAMFAPHLFLKARQQADHLAKLEAENRKLRQDKQRYEASLAHIGEQLAAFENVAGRLAKAVGMREAPFVKSAGGGPMASSRGLLEEELEALSARAENLDRSFDHIHAAYEERAKLLATTPSLMPAQGPFSDGFGWRADPFTGEREFHKGVDIVAPLGSPVRATADGIVTAAGRMEGYGRMIHLSHGPNLATRYGHLSDVLVRPGQRVKRGDVIGRVGSTGRSSGPHLHYEVFKGDRQVDPRKYLGEALF